MPPKKSTGPRRQLPWDNDTKIRLIVLVYTTEKWRKVIIGPAPGENTIGMTRPIAYQEIAAELFPDFVRELGSVKVATRVQEMFENLQKTYKKEEKRLRKTGEGINGQGATAGQVNTYCMVSCFGPDERTDPDICNIWDEIMKDHPWFETMHRYCGKPPTIIPPTQITGVAPVGRIVQHNHLGPPPVRRLPPPLPDSTPIDPALYSIGPHPPQLGWDAEAPSSQAEMPLPPSQVPRDRQPCSSSPPTTPSLPAPMPAPRPLSGTAEAASPPSTLQQTTSKALARDPALQSLIDKAEKKYKPTASKRSLEELLGENIKQTTTIFKKRLEQDQQKNLNEYTLREKEQLHQEREDLFQALKLGLYTPRTAGRRLQAIDARAEEFEKYSRRTRKRLRKEMYPDEPSSDDIAVEVPSSPSPSA
ncbi:hypothetical protein GGG16DRAFT_113649 [Schizophyllum commune]